MTIYILTIKKKGKRTLPCWELFGLPKSGKTTFLSVLTKKGYQTMQVVQKNTALKIFNFLKYVIKYPFSTSYLFFKLNTNQLPLSNLRFWDKLLTSRMRNSYLGAVLAKCETLVMYSKPIVDEFMLQSLFMIIQSRSSVKELQKIIDNMPLSEKIFLVETSKRTRDQRLKSIRKPARVLDPYYKALWIENSEYNYAIIKEILLNYYTLKKFNLDTRK